MVAKRWNSQIYDITKILKVFDEVIGDIELPNYLNPKKYDVILILKVLVIKVFLDISLRVAENLSVIFLGIRIDHSVIHYWEKRLRDYIVEIVNLILKRLWNFDYGKTFIDSTIFSNKAGEQIKIHAITRYDPKNKTLFPVSIGIEKPDLKFPQGEGYFYGDGEYDDKDTLNNIAKSNYKPMIKKTKRGCRGYGAKIRDKIFNKDEYNKRWICEGFFGALINKYSDKLNTSLLSTSITRIAVCVCVYALTMVLRYLIN